MFFGIVLDVGLCFVYLALWMFVFSIGNGCSFGRWFEICQSRVYFFPQEKIEKLMENQGG